LKAPIAEEGRSLGYQLVFLVAAVSASFDLIDPAIRRHNPIVRAEAAIVPRPMRIDDIDLPPIVTVRIRSSAVCPVFRLLPSAVKILHIRKFREAPAIGADEYQRVGKKPNPAWLREDKLSLVNERLVLVIEECAVYALFG
jgi:hypothetical protein